MGNKPVRVLVVDDSAYIRKVFSQMLSQSPQIEVVGTAMDGQDALEKTERLKPDVVTVDLFMPYMDGVEYLRQQMQRRPLPVVVITSAEEDEQKVLEAMDAGGVEFVQKPTSRADDRILDMQRELITKVTTAAKAQVSKLPARVPAPAASQQPLLPAHGYRGSFDAIVIGISTGGPQALRSMLPHFPAGFPVPLAIVLHMPVSYTGPFAQRLNDASQLEVLEAVEGLSMQPGRAILAQAGRHLTLQAEQNGLVTVHLSLEPAELLHRPSVDVFFKSAAQVFGPRTLAVVMTGMGDDGMKGAAWIKAQGGTVFTESEESAIIYGMPRAVVEAGLSDKIVTLEEMPRAVIEAV